MGYRSVLPAKDDMAHIKGGNAGGVGAQGRQVFY